MKIQTIPQTIEIEGSNSLPISLDVSINSLGMKDAPVVIFCHGYKGFKDWGCWNLVAEKFANSGFNFLKFNFSHNGVTSSNRTEFDDLNAFGNNNYTKELSDLESVINWVKSEKSQDPLFDTESIFIIGHSRGGGIVSLAAAQNENLKRAVVWASVFDLTNRLPKNTEEWKKQGVVYQLNGRTNQEMPLFYQFYENTILNKKELSIAIQGKKVSIPFCIIHGMDDKAVSFEEAEKLHEVIPTSELILMENTGHTFGSSHPWKENNLPKELNEVVEETIRFLKD